MKLFVKPGTAGGAGCSVWMKSGAGISAPVCSSRITGRQISSGICPTGSLDAGCGMKWKRSLELGVFASSPSASSSSSGARSGKTCISGMAGAGRRFSGSAGGSSLSGSVGSGSVGGRLRGSDGESAARRSSQASATGVSARSGADGQGSALVGRAGRGSGSGRPVSCTGCLSGLTSG